MSTIRTANKRHKRATSHRARNSGAASQASTKPAVKTTIKDSESEQAAQ